jgi:hypothetical protein
LSQTLVDRLLLSLQRVDGGMISGKTGRHRAERPTALA